MPSPPRCLLAALLLTFATGAAAQGRDGHPDSGSAEPDPNTIVIVAPGLRRPDSGATATADAIRGVGRPDLREALEQASPALSLQDSNGNPFTPNLVYRGFTISPLQGQAQGLAVYVDGGRFNQPFGETVLFDVLPEAAIDRLEILPSRSAYGLNALGGAVAITTKNGRSAPGVFLSASGGGYAEREATLEAGASKGRSSFYVAIEEREDGGWRRFSPSILHNGLADLGWEGENAGAHIKLIIAETKLSGDGTAPTELLNADYRGVFTHPDMTRHSYGRLSLQPYLRLGRATRVEATLYHQRLAERTLNGDVADIAACSASVDLLCLSDAEGNEQPLRSVTGQTVAALNTAANYGLLNRSRTHSVSSGLLLQLNSERSIGPWHNAFSVGLSYDGGRTHFDSASELGTVGLDRKVAGTGSVIAQPDDAIAPVSLTFRGDTAALYVSDAVGIGPVTVSSGVRWTRARSRLSDKLGTELNGQHVFSHLNPQFGFEWRATSMWSIAAAFSETNRSPSPAELSCADSKSPCSFTNFFVADPPLRQVVASTAEVTVRRRSGPFEGSLAVYRTDARDDILFVASEIRGRAYFRNVGGTRRQGLEVSLAYRSGRVSVRAGYALTDATFRSGLRVNSPDNPAADALGSIEVRPGSRLPGIPRHRALLSVAYETPAWTVRVAMRAASGQYLLGDEGNLNPATKPYGIVDLGARRRVAAHLSAFAEIRNLFDRHYATFGTFASTADVPIAEAPGASNPRSLAPGAPRRWTIGLRADF